MSPTTSRAAMGWGAAVFAVALLPLPAAAAEAGSTIEVQAASVAGTTILVQGVVNYGADALGPITLAEDAAGDSAVPNAGYDVGNVSVETDLAGNKLIFTLDLHDGVPAPVDGPGPFTGYMVPIMSDGDERWRWLAAGGAGTNFAPSTGKWGGLCHNEQQEGQQGGWDCPDTLTTTITADSVRWELPFSNMKPAIKHGSVIESSSIFCGGPCSFEWPSLFALGLVPIDPSVLMDQYKIPGEVELGIAPAGTPLSGVSFTAKATYSPQTGGFSGAIAAPTSAGTYNLWARTCYGTPISCVTSSKPIQIAS